MQSKSGAKKDKTAGVDIIRRLKPIVDEINQAVKGLDPAIKESMAVSLWNAAVGNVPTDSVEATDNRGHVQSSSSEVGGEVKQLALSTLGEYVQHKNPQTTGHRAVTIAGFFLEKHGTDIVTVEQVKQSFEELGEPVPDRLDNTIRQTSFEGKKLFQKKGKDWKLNFHGQQFLKNHLPIKEEKSQRRTVRRKKKKKSAKAKSS